jgi:uncharacterized protein YaiL (DUF2058 family)
MSDSIRDQLLGLGFKQAPRPERSKPAPSAPGGKPKQQGAATPQRGAPPHKPQRPHPARNGAPAAGARRGGEMDLAKAYAIRAQREKDERIAAERERQLEAQRRREGKLKLAELLKTATLNDPAAEVARHFEYGGKIRRIYVTPDQLRALNGGTLAVVQHGGRYHLVSLEHAQAAEALLAGALALQVDPDAPPGDDQYADPKYQVPDDLVW